MEITQKELNSLIFMSFRYALGRQTYIVGDCVDILLKYWGDIDTNIQKLIKREITEAIERDVISSVDLASWNSILGKV
jgi:hypothetical protein